MRLRNFNWMVCSIALFASGCTTVKIPQASGGSRSDGVVEMSFDYALFERLDIQWDKAQAEAVYRCKLWGYKNAQRFKGVETSCQDYSPDFGCVSSIAKIKYQCIR